MAFMFQGQASIEKDWGDQAPPKSQKMLEKLENSSMKTGSEQFMSSPTQLGLLMEFATRS
jgi:hypothetical protein